MKINLIHVDGQKMGGFQNINSVMSDDEESVWCDLRNLDAVVDDAEAEYILARDVINYVPLEEMGSTVAHWSSKLRHGGKISIGAVDLKELSRMVHTGEISEQESNIALYGSPVKVKRNIFNIKTLTDFLSSVGLQIIKSKINGYNMIVEAQRP
jgi:predicted SAM-dependent methyltransferase